MDEEKDNETTGDAQPVINEPSIENISFPNPIGQTDERTGIRPAIIN